MNTNRVITAEVAIVGGGPVGMGLAIELGQRGVRTVVIERYPSPQRVPKGQNLTQRTMEHFHFWRAEEALRAARTIPKEYGIGGLTAYGTLLGKHHYDWLQRELVRPYYFTDNERLPQYATEEVLRARAAELDTVELLYGWTVTDVGQDAESATVSAEGPEGKLLVRSGYVVGCDGSRSLVRERGGITQTRSDHDRTMVLIVFRSKELHGLLQRFPGKSYYNVLHPDLEGYWQFFGRVDPDETWFFHAPVPRGTTKDNFDFVSYLHRAVGAPFEVEFEHVGFWDLRFAIADRYRNGRLFIAGDAAHSHPPYGGYGVNTGFEDARNLGWKLAAVLQGWGGPQLLDSYDAERRPVFVSTARDFIEKSIDDDRTFLAAFDPERDRDAFLARWSARASGASGEVNAFEPHYDGSPIVIGGQGESGAVGAHRFEARPGHHLAPPLPLSSGQDFYAERTPGFTLLAMDGKDEAIERFRKVAEIEHVPLKIVADDGEAASERCAARYVLVRPDQFVAWASKEEPADPSSIIRQATGSPPRS